MIRISRPAELANATNDRALTPMPSISHEIDFGQRKIAAGDTTVGSISTTAIQSPGSARPTNWEPNPVLFERQATGSNHEQLIRAGYPLHWKTQSCCRLRHIALKIASRLSLKVNGLAYEIKQNPFCEFAMLALE